MIDDDNVDDIVVDDSNYFESFSVDLPLSSDLLANHLATLAQAICQAEKERQGWVPRCRVASYPCGIRILLCLMCLKMGAPSWSRTWGNHEKSFWMFFLEGEAPEEVDDDLEESLGLQAGRGAPVRRICGLCETGAFQVGNGGMG